MGVAQYIHSCPVIMVIGDMFGNTPVLADALRQKGIRKFGDGILRFAEHTMKLTVPIDELTDSISDHYAVILTCSILKA